MEHVIYPSPGNTFKALKEVDYDDVKVVILGQDPYHDGSATGRCFENGTDKVPPSLRNIVKKLKGQPDWDE